MTAETNADANATATGSGEAPVSVGRYLRAAREKKKFSLDQVAHTTKIRKAILDALERDAFRELPEKVFVTGYVRSYAACVGLPVEEAVERLRSGWVDAEGDGDPESSELRPIPTGPNLGWIVPTLAALLAAGVIWMILSSV